MLGPCRYCDPVVFLTDQLEHLIADMEAKQPSALHKETHLVFAVGVFSQKLLAQGGPIGVAGFEPYRIHGGEVSVLLHPGHIRGVGPKDLGLLGASGQLGRGFPSLKLHPPEGKFGGNQGGVAGDQLGQGRQSPRFHVGPNG